MASESVVRIRVSLKGRPLKAYRFSQDVVVIGRAPDSDVVLDNTGVSRHHARVERREDGFVLVDLGSANGTNVNHMPVREHKLVENDMVGIAKFSLWISFADDSRADPGRSADADKPAEGTTVLSNAQLERILESVRETEQNAPAVAEETAPAWPPRPQEPAPEPAKGGSARGLVLGFLLGAAAGSAATWYLLLQ